MVVAQLYKLPGGNQVDGVPPAASLGESQLKRSWSQCGWSQVGHVGRRKIEDMEKSKVREATQEQF